MRIEKKIKDHLVFSGDSILDALKRINDNQSRIVFVVQDNGVLIGAVSDGDVRRWMTQATEFNLNLPVDHVMNRNFIARPVTESQHQIADYFDHKRDIIPLIDEQGRFCRPGAKISHRTSDRGLPDCRPESRIHHRRSR